MWTAPHNFQRTGRQTDLGADALGPRIVVVVEAAKGIEVATFNARAETFATKPMFRSAFKRNRCLIPVSGYYEWQDTLGGKQLWYFTARDGSRALTIAGLGDEWQDMGSRQVAQILHHDHHRAQQVRCRSARPDAGSAR